MKLPFCIIPAHWGLRGKAKEIAKINYDFEGYDADIRCADLLYLTDYEIAVAKNEIEFKYRNITDLQYKNNALDIEFKFNKISEVQYKKSILKNKLDSKDITEKEYDLELVEMMEEGDAKKLAAADYAFKYHLITESEYSKELFTLRKEPWMDFNVDFDPHTNQVEFTFDYNEYFWKQLKEQGHPGTTEDEIIENFIRDWGRKVSNDEYIDNPDVNLTTLNDELMKSGELPDGFKLYT